MQEKMRGSDERLQRVIMEKKEHIAMVKNDFVQVIEVAKQEVQRKYVFEIK